MASDPDPVIEWCKCADDVAHFVRHYLSIYDATAQDWRPFALWPAQAATLRTMAHGRKLVVLKARQLGITWLSLAYALWLLLFRSPATVLLFSLREAEAKELLWRLRGMYERLPAWMQAERMPLSNETRWMLSTGSRALAFSTTSGRSYTGTLALVDEADFVPELSQFLNAVKPTIDAGGQLFLVSTSDKKRPVSTFKNLFRAALQGTGDYQQVFLPWSARPERDARWYATTKAEMYAQRGTDDDFYAEYPASPDEALAAEQLDRRIPLAWLQACLETDREIWQGDAPALPGLVVWDAPIPGRRYVIGADPAEGNPNSDDSAAVVLDAERWTQAAEIVGKVEPSVFAGYIAAIGAWYNRADVMPERNNHGHLLIRALQEDGRLQVLSGYDNKPGWLSNVKGKPLLYGLLAGAVRDGACVVRSVQTAAQITSIEASTLRAPAPLPDDRADAFALAVSALAWRGTVDISTVAPAPDPLAEYDSPSNLVSRTIAIPPPPSRHHHPAITIPPSPSRHRHVRRGGFHTAGGGCAPDHPPPPAVVECARPRAHLARPRAELSAVVECARPRAHPARPRAELPALTFSRNRGPMQKSGTHPIAPAKLKAQPF